MGKIVLFIHTTLDGFVAGPNREMDWINVDDEIFDFAGNNTDKADTALYGRVTYQMMESYWPTAADQPTATKHDIQHSNWYNRVTKVVLSKSLKDQTLPNTKIISDNLAAEINKLKEGTTKDILIFGSPGAVHSLLAKSLIDDFWLFINPVLLGHGIPLFGNIKERIKLKLVTSHAFASGVICLHYERWLDNVKSTATIEIATVKKNVRTCSKGHKYYKTSDCPTCPVCERENKPATGFLSVISAPARRALERQGVKTPRQLSKKKEAEILQLHGMGPTTLPKLRSALATVGLSFKNNYPWQIQKNYRTRNK